MRSLRALATVALLVSVPSFALANHQEELKAAHEVMMHEMMKPLSGDADKDFVMMMIPHHQGAIDMAKVQLKYGKDPMLRALAEAIIAAQEKEIGDMRKWQAEHP